MTITTSVNGASAIMRHFYVTKAYKKPFVLNTIFGYLFNPYGHMKADWKKIEMSRSPSIVAFFSKPSGCLKRTRERRRNTKLFSLSGIFWKKNNRWRFDRSKTATSTDKKSFHWLLIVGSNMKIHVIVGNPKENRNTWNNKDIFLREKKSTKT